MPGSLPLILLWHFHQPLYKDPLTGVSRLPWVRLHGVGAYTTMAMLAAEFSELPVTFNLVPSLLLQIEDYASGRGSDPWLDLALKPAEELTPAERDALLRSFFLASPETMIFPHPRYRQLWQLRGIAPQAAAGWTPSQLRDLQVWFHLAWTSPLVRTQDPVASELVAKGEGFSEEDKHALLALHRALLGALVSRYRQLQDSGCVELSTSPFYHPILPLLCDLAVAREADPAAPTAESFAYPEDAREQITRALRFHQERFGRRPEGLWPSEGGVSEAVLRLAEEAELRWLATDEVVLRRSLERSGRPAPAWPCPAIWEGAPEVALFFRQHDLSDWIGFRYARLPAAQAVADLVEALHAICRGLPSEARDAVVTLALDGENPWESYPEQGVEFLRTLYRTLAHDPELRPLTPRQFLSNSPPTLRLFHLSPGSWIDGTFRIWAGHSEDLAAWRLLGRARAAVGRADPATVQPGPLEAAWEALFAAEGSDWTWWYGEDHTSGMDEVFDELFRRYVRAVYVLLGHEVPPEVLEPISQKKKLQFEHLPPSGVLEPVLDGRVSHFFEWQNAGVIVPRQGAMDTTPGPIRRLLYGFTPRDLCLRLDPDPAQWPLAHGFLILERPSMTQSLCRVPLIPGTRQFQAPLGIIELGVGEVVELLLPEKLLGPVSQGRIALALTVTVGGREVQRIPDSGWLSLERPP